VIVNMNRIPKQENSTQYTEQDIMAVWRSEWQGEAHTSIKTQFSRLFTEGYRVYKKYLPREDASFTMLEIGAGSGRYGIAIARDYKHSRVTITDPLAESIHLIRSAVHELNLSNVVVQEEDSLNLSFPDNTFDVVFGDVVIQHIIRREDAMKELRRVLKPGGTLILSTVNSYNPPHRLLKWVLACLNREYSYGYERTYTPRELQDFFTQEGFSQVQLDGFYAAYGVYRWGYTYKPFKIIGRVLNRIISYIDPYIRRWVSRKLGFIILCAGVKEV
jgi:ubiquinone/menaquinone biosynthesis C-methylase UbiE